MTVHGIGCRCFSCSAVADANNPYIVASRKRSRLESQFRVRWGWSWLLPSFTYGAYLLIWAHSLDVQKADFASTAPAFITSVLLWAVIYLASACGYAQTEVSYVENRLKQE